MTASQAHAFYREVAERRVVWTIRDERGYPTVENSAGKRSQPFWSSRSRIERIQKFAPDYSGFGAVEIPWDDFRDKWLPFLEKTGCLIGVNWSGRRVAGFDLDPALVRRAVEGYIHGPPEQSRA
jgi:hypothetical protein